MTSQELVQQQRELVAFADDPKLRAELEPLLPPDISVPRFLRGLKNAALKNPDILKCDHASLYRAVLASAADELIPDGKQAAITTAFNKKTQTLEAVYMPMIEGIRFVFARHGWSLRTAVIHANDEFEDHSAEGFVVHKPPRPGVERGSVEGAYAMAIHKDGRREAVVYSEAQIQDVRRKSSRSSNVWEAWPDQMREKTPAHRLAKKMPWDPADRARIDQMFAADENGDDATTLLYGSEDRGAGQRSSLPVPDAREGAVPQSAPSLQPEPEPAPEDADWGPVENEADLPAWEGEEPPPISDEPTAEEKQADEFKFTSGRHSGMTLDEVLAVGDAGLRYAKWAWKNWKTDPERAALDAYAETHPEIKS
jgi:phage RecT family recombinase